ncbi:MAG: glycoside hydrolase family 3 C-terminal domain-containing protein, partial [Bifidobacteriaceae bacterium]|nr:glycoside hydrolase family 3 C-terminal domain-containing protein [Bifidobacteriaceae bacterium]
NWWNEALHGVARAHGNSTNPAQWLNQGGEATEFPTGLGIAATWNRQLVFDAMDAASDEARAYNNYTEPLASVAAKHKGLTYWSPTINMDRDPRWGRAEESYGEDPYLTAEIGGQFTLGMQGSHPVYLKTAVTPKHYLANNSETNRHTGSSNLTEAELREYYTPAFADLMGPYGAKSMMTAYNKVNTVAMSASREFIEVLARRTWGFDGVVTSDCGAVRDVYNTGEIPWVPPGWTAPVTQRQAVAYTLKAGTELDCMDGAYQGNATGNGLEAAYANGMLSDADIDVALTRAFKVRMEFGEFDAPDKVPWTGDDYSTANQISAPDHLATSLQMSDEAVVMLKNDHPIGSAQPMAPLTAQTARNIVLVGPLAEYEVHGDYSPARLKEHKNPLQGIQAAAAATGATVTYIPGITGTASQWQWKKPTLGRNISGYAVVRYLDSAAAEIGRFSLPDLVRSEDYDGWNAWSGSVPNTLGSRGAWGGYFGAPVSLTGANQAGDIAWIEVDTSNGTYIPDGSFEVHAGSKTGPVLGSIPIPAAVSNSNYTTLRLAVPGLDAGQRLYFVYRNAYYQPALTGDANANSIPDDDEIRAADAVIAFVGTIAPYGGENIDTIFPPVPGNPSDSSEDEDRSSLELPRGQDRLIQAVADLNPRTVVWIQAVSQVDVESFKDRVPALFWSTYNGMYQGDTVGRILWGQANPSAKLPITFYADVDDLPPAKDYTMTPTDGKAGRTYQYFTGRVSYPFGFGLSYSTFEYSNLRLSQTDVDVDGTVTATVDIRNTSNRDGQEVVQLYATSPDAASPHRPDQQLKGFTKVAIRAGSLKQVSIELKASDLWFWDSETDSKAYDLGTWKLRLGPSADPSEGLWTDFRLSGELTPAIGVVTAVPDGVVLNTRTPGNAIHANLSASRNDDSFYDLDAVSVTYASAKPWVAAVDQSGTVRPVGPGVTHITATVRADGSVGQTTFPVVVLEGSLGAGDVTLYAQDVSFPDRTVSLAQAQAGVQLAAAPAPASPDAAFAYSLSLAENDSNHNAGTWESEAGLAKPAGAGAAVTPEGLLTADRPGTVRVTVVADLAGVKYTRSATVLIEGPTEVTRSALSAAIANVESGIVGGTLVQADNTVTSWAALEAALASARGIMDLAEASQQSVDSAVARLEAARAGLAPRGDLSRLAAMLAAMDALAPAAGRYTADSWAALSAAAAT